MDCRGQTSIFSSNPANDMKVLVKFCHSLKVNDTINTLSMAPSISVLKEFDYIENCFAFLVLGSICYAYRTPPVTIYAKLII